MAQEFKLPDLGEGLTEGEIARWLVSEGQEVAEGEVAPVGAPLVLIGDPGEVVEPSAPVTPSDTVSQGVPRAVGEGGAARVQATPLVRRIAEELGVDLAGVSGTGPNGRITEDDVRAAAAGAATEGRREPLRGVRRLIAEHMARAQQVPAVTWVEECDFENVELGRLVATVLKACASTLPDYPELNARLEQDAIVYLDRYDVGVAVQTEHGLVVPVVRGCDAKSVAEIDDEVARLAEGARAGTLRAEELRGSTFTVTSAGKVAGLFQTPLVNHPEVAILSVGRIAPRPVVRDGDVVARPVGHVAVTFDHRVVDGARAAEFGLTVIARLESGNV